MRTELDGGVLTLYLEGRVDSQNAGEFEECTLAAIDAAPGASVVVDAAGLEYLSSAGLRVLMKLMKRTERRLVVTNVAPQTYEILDVTGFTDLMDVKRCLGEISVAGCELICQGDFGKAYRIDEETVAKVYKPGISFEFVEQERNVSQKAFLTGVPVAISYDVVRCGECFGVVFGMPDVQTTAQIIAADPSKVLEIASRSARLLKRLHAIEPGQSAGLPDRKQQLYDWADSLSDYLTQEETGKIYALINKVPDRETFLYGDFNAKNILLRGGELQFIDIGGAAIGHPVFDIAGLVLHYLVLPNVRDGQSVEERLDHLGFDFDYAPSMWDTMCKTYFHLSSSEDVEELTRKLMPYAYLLMAHQATRNAGDDERSVANIVNSVVRQRLLPATENLSPLGF